MASESFFYPTIGSRNIQENPKLVVRRLENAPPGLRLTPGQCDPGEVVAVFNGFNGTMKLYVASGDAKRLIPVVG